MASDRTPSRLRERRLQAGLTQTELAARAGVSRQLVAAVESGRNVPAVGAALRLARALTTSAEDLFSPLAAAVVPALGKPLPDGAVVHVARVADQLVAAELADHGAAGAAWASADGVVENGKLRLFPGAIPAGLVLAGCDPALGIAEAALQARGPSRLLALSASTGAALAALARGTLHGCVVHGPEDAFPRPPLPVIRLHLARWQVGLATPRTHAPSSLEALLEGEIVQRESGAASQQALERAAARAGLRMRPGQRADGHLDAARSAALLGCAALTTESAARAFDLRFDPLEEHRVEVWLDRRWSQYPATEALANLLASRAFTTRVAGFGGYDLAECGTRVGTARAGSLNA
ncbi:MAG: helix-turn-helix domain-containing protein [Solirubrobacterales bacterium]|nr:helix-turn-helix domain-containing protein [Solirubrobacterales bacterium]